MKQTRLVLTQNTTEEDVAGIAGALELYPFDLRSNGAHTYERIFATPDQQSALAYVEDHAIGLRYITLVGPAAAELEVGVRQRIPLISPELVYPLFEHAQSREEWMTAITHGAAVSNTDFDPRMFEGFRQALQHPDDDVRKAAIFAATYPGWKEFEAPLQQLREADPSLEVQYMARKVVDTLSSSWHEEGGQ